MQKTVARNHIFNHRLLNHLNASYQGKFAEINILSQLNHPDFDPEQIKKIKAVLLFIKGWLEKLYGGECILDEERLFVGVVGEQVLGTLKVLEMELPQHATRTKAWLISGEPAEVRNNTAALVAAFGRSAYARDNYLRGFIKFGRLIDDQEMVTRYSAGLDVVGKDLQIVGEMVNTVREAADLEPGFVDHVRFCCRMLPGIFRAQAHDIRQLLGGPRHLPGFDEIGFMRPEQEEWRSAGFSPVDAGYWRAHEIAAAEALFWKAVGVEDPYQAAEWKTAGFAPETASLWLEVKFSPLLAIQWHNCNIPPQVALEYVKQGIQAPYELPENILEQFLPREQPNSLPIQDAPEAGNPDAGLAPVPVDQEQPAAIPTALLKRGANEPVPAEPAKTKLSPSSGKLRRGGFLEDE